MLVEDDKSLREIYGVRLLAEGYDIVSAGDGEEALAMAIKERPSLIITDVMMPRISGFDMLDILRSTTETKNIKVIMMTALSSEDQRRHGEQLGADRYLVKSQVGIEDVVRVVHEVLADKPAGPALVTPAVPAAPPSGPSAIQPTAAPPATTALPTTPRTMAPAQPRTMQNDPVVTPVTPIPGAQTLHVMPAVNSTVPAMPSARQRIIQPISDPAKKVDINGLLDRELARQAGVDVINAATTQQEKATVADQLQRTMPPVAPPTPAQPLPPIAPRPPVQPQPRTITVTTPVPPRPDGTPPAPAV